MVPFRESLPADLVLYFGGSLGGAIGTDGPGAKLGTEEGI